MYRLVVIDGRAIEDLCKAILEECKVKGNSTLLSFSDVGHIANIWLGKQPQLPRTNYKGEQF